MHDDEPDDCVDLASDGVVPVQRAREEVTALAAVDANGDTRVYAGLADGSVWELDADVPAPLPVLPATGAPVRALAVRADGAIVVVDAARRVHVARGRDVRTCEIPVQAGRAGHTFGPGGPPAPRVVCAALDPRGTHVVVALDDGVSPADHAVLVFDLETQAVVTPLQLATRPNDDCIEVDFMAYDATGARLAVSCLGVRYTSDGDWAWGQDRRAMIFAMPEGRLRMVHDVGQTMRPSEHAPMAVAFAGTDLVVGPYVIDATADDARYFSEDAVLEWCDDDVTAAAVAAEGNIVLGADDSSVWARDLDSDDVSPLRITVAQPVGAVVADPSALRFYLGQADGQVLEWRIRRR